MDTVALKESADNHFNNGRLPEALDAYKQLCALNPGSAHAWHMCAAIHGKLGQFQDSILCSEKALSINPDAASLHSNYATALVELKRYKDAMQAFNNAIALNPADIYSLSKLGELRSSTNDLEGAADCFRRVLKLDPQAIDAAAHLAYTLKESGNYTESIEICENALQLEPANRTLVMTQLECCFLSGAADKAHQRITVSRPLIPNIINPLYRICKKLRDDKRYKEATIAIQAVLAIFHEDDYFRLLLADCQIRQNQIQEASTTLQQLSGCDITLEAQVLLANAYNDTGQADKAEHQLSNTTRQHPDEEIPVALLARNLCRSGRYAEAATALKYYLQRHPDSPKILVELGTVSELNGDPAEAEKLYLRATSIDTDYAIAYSRLGVLNQCAQRYTMARDHFEKALQCDPDLLIVRCSLAHLFCSRGEYTTALELYDKVLDIDPLFEVAVAGKASVLERTGDQEAAFRLVQPLAEGGTDNIHTLLAYAHSCQVAGKEATAASLLEQALARSDILPDDRKHACFMLGKLLDRLGKYDQAFLSYRRGNELNRFHFDRDAHLRFVNALISVFSSENMKVFPRSSNRTARPVFIVGMPRSGTTLTEHILASHPDIYGAGELPHVRKMAAGLTAASASHQAFPLCMPTVSEETLDRLSSEYLHTLESLADNQPLITDKMPSNFMFLGLVELLFPNACILHCVRDPLDTCLSCYFQNFSSGQFFSYNQLDLAFYYNQYRRLMRHWKSTLRIPIMDIHYEQLVGDQERISRMMIEYIGLEWHAGCLDFHKSERKIRTASYDQVRRPVYRTSVKRWKKYANHLTVLQDALSE